MNKQEILNLKPGREFNLLISEKVLGISVKDKLNAQNEVKDLSSDPSTIWTIISRLSTKDFTYTITNTNDYEHSCIFDSLNSHKRYIAHADSLMEAVCKASLMAVFGEEEHRKRMKAKEQ